MSTRNKETKLCNSFRVEVSLDGIHFRVRVQYESIHEKIRNVPKAYGMYEPAIDLLYERFRVIFKMESSKKSCPLQILLYLTHLRICTTHNYIQEA